MLDEGVGIFSYLFWCKGIEKDTFQCIEMGVILFFTLRFIYSFILVTIVFFAKKGNTKEKIFFRRDFLEGNNKI